MKLKYAIVFVFFMSLRPAAYADDFSIALGIINLADEGADISLGYRMQQSHWQYGLRYLRWSDTFHDPYTGNAHSKTTDTLAGLTANYLFSNEARHSGYVGISLLKWTRTETPLLVAAPSDTQSSIDPYFGGGYMGRIGSMGYYNAGMYLAPTAKMKTQTAISSTDQSGNFDIQLQIGLAW